MDTMVLRTTKCYSRDLVGNGCVLATLRFFGVIGDQIDLLSLREIKRCAKNQYIEYLFKIHPDRGGRGYLYRSGDHVDNKGGQKVYVAQVKKMFNRVNNLKYKPLTVDNCEKVLEISKEYKTTEDVDFGLNGFV